MEECEKMLERLSDKPRTDVVFVVTNTLSEFCHMTLFLERASSSSSSSPERTADQKENMSEYLSDLISKLALGDGANVSQSPDDFPIRNPLDFIVYFFNVTKEPLALCEAVSSDQFLNINLISGSQPIPSNDSFYDQTVRLKWNWKWSLASVETRFLLPIENTDGDSNNDDDDNDEEPIDLDGRALFEQIKRSFRI